MLLFNADPILKWAGGKQIVAATLLRHFPRQFARYYEPFVGGGSVLFGLCPREAVIGDLNDWLLDTYRAIRGDYRRVAAILDGIVNTKEEYLRVRDIDPASLDLYTRAAQFVRLRVRFLRRAGIPW